MGGPLCCALPGARLYIPGAHDGGWRARCWLDGPLFSLEQGPGPRGARAAQECSGGEGLALFCHGVPPLDLLTGSSLRPPQAACQSRPRPWLPSSLSALHGPVSCLPSVHTRFPAWFPGRLAFILRESPETSLLGRPSARLLGAGPVTLVLCPTLRPVLVDRGVSSRSS